MHKKRKTATTRILMMFAALACSSVIQANWTLNGEASSLSYLSTKVAADSKTSTTERNYFSRMTGSVDDAGKTKVIIDLSSLETSIPIRNERMLKHVFNAPVFPKASLTTRVPPSATMPGARNFELAITLSMNGHAKTINIPVHVSATESSMTVTPADIVLVNASDFGMSEGLAMMTELAGLAHIPETVPVSFQLSFSK